MTNIYRTSHVLSNPAARAREMTVLLEQLGVEPAGLGCVGFGNFGLGFRV